MVELFKLYWAKISGLSTWGVIGSYFLSLLSPLAPMVIPIILFTAMDIFTGIKASQKEKARKDVVESKSWKNKMILLTPFIIGLLACRLLEFTTVGAMDINILGLEIKNALSSFWAGLFFMNETISILENVSRMGYKAGDPIIKLLRIKKDDIIEKLEKKEDKEEK